MNDTVQTLLRALIKIGAGYAISKGLADDNQVQVISAGMMAAGAVLWGVLHRRTDKAQAVPIKSSPFEILLLCGCLAAGSGAVLVGCASGPQRVAYNVQAGAQITVDEAMKLWGDYVHQFHPPAAQEQKVKELYDQAKAAAMAAIDASELYAAAVSSGSTNTVAERVSAEAARQLADNRLADLVGALRLFGVKI